MLESASKNRQQQSRKASVKKFSSSHQHPLPSKGKSAFVGKGKATALPAASQLPPAEVTVVPISDIVMLPPSTAEESREPSPPKPVAAIVPKPIISTEERQNKANEQLEIPASTSQIDADLALSSDTSDKQATQTLT